MCFLAISTMRIVLSADTFNMYDLKLGPNWIVLYSGDCNIIKYNYRKLVVVLQSNKMRDSVNAQLLSILGRGASCNSTISGTTHKTELKIKHYCVRI